MEKDVQVNIVAAILTAGHIVNTKHWEETTEEAIDTFKQYQEKLKDIL